MPLTPGERLGPFEILAPLGAGGMGEVCRARDTKLKRDVALKILPEHFTTDPDRPARFQREAEVLATLNHPNIAHIHGLEDVGTTRALVTELVEGEDLAQRLARGPIPLHEALPIARQIAEALETAHEQGIIHRDLTPANVKVRDDSTVKGREEDLRAPPRHYFYPRVSPDGSRIALDVRPAMSDAGGGGALMGTGSRTAGGSRDGISPRRKAVLAAVPTTSCRTAYASS